MTAAAEIDLASTSRSGDAGCLAARDLARIATDLGLEYRSCRPWALPWRRRRPGSGRG